MLLMENTEDLAQNKLVLLYIIEMSPHPFTKEQLSEFVLERNYMNYFLIQQYLGELLSSNFIKLDDKDAKQVYTILKSGKVALHYFEDRISDSIKEDVREQFGQKEKETLLRTQILCDYYEKENAQFVVNIKLVENNDTLLSLYLDVVTKKQAELICEKWKKNTEYIYQNIINLFISEETER